MSQKSNTRVLKLYNNDLRCAFKRELESAGIGSHLDYLFRLSRDISYGVSCALTTFKAFKRSLMQGTAMPQGLQFLCVVSRNGFIGFDDIRAVQTVYQLLHLGYKTQGLVEVKPDWPSFVERLGTSGNVTVSDSEFVEFGKILRRIMPRSISTTYGRARGASGSVAEGSDPTLRWSLVNHPSMPYIPLYPVNKRAYKRTARATCVPKDSRGPRYICMEPGLSQFHAQGYMAVHMDHISRNLKQAPLKNPNEHKLFLLRNYFTHVTIDLKDATDLLSVGLLGAFPAYYRRMVDTLRSKEVETPLGTSLLTAMFPMGNSLCFVTLTYVIIALCELSCDNSYSVYGDDIICHRDDYACLVDRLHRFGMKVNQDKCGLTALKETCGLDLLHSTSLNPVYLRLWDPEGPKGKWAIASAADQLFSNGLCYLAEYFASLLPSGWRKYRTRYNKDLQRLEYFVPTLVDKTRETNLLWPFSGYRWLATRADGDNADLSRSTESLSLSSHRTVIRFKWSIVTPFNLTSRD